MRLTSFTRTILAASTASTFSPPSKSFSPWPMDRSSAMERSLCFFLPVSAASDAPKIPADCSTSILQGEKGQYARERLLEYSEWELDMHEIRTSRERGHRGGETVAFYGARRAPCKPRRFARGTVFSHSELHRSIRRFSRDALLGELLTPATMILWHVHASGKPPSKASAPTRPADWRGIH